jgi:hypothetical protein
MNFEKLDGPLELTQAAEFRGRYLKIEVFMAFFDNVISIGTF